MSLSVYNWKNWEKKLYEKSDNNCRNIFDMTIIVKSIISQKNYRLTIKVDLLKSEQKITEHNCRL